jgi:hypothetical protein
VWVCVCVRVASEIFVRQCPSTVTVWTMSLGFRA